MRTYKPSLHKQIRRRDSRAATQWRRDLKRAFDPAILAKRAAGGKWPQSIERLPACMRGELGAAILIDTSARFVQTVRAPDGTPVATITADGPVDLAEVSA